MFENCQFKRRKKEEEEESVEWNICEKEAKNENGNVSTEKREIRKSIQELKKKERQRGIEWKKTDQLKNWNTQAEYNLKIKVVIGFNLKYKSTRILLWNWSMGWFFFIFVLFFHREMCMYSVKSIGKWYEIRKQKPKKENGTRFRCKKLLIYYHYHYYNTCVFQCIFSMFYIDLGAI